VVDHDRAVPVAEADVRFRTSRLVVVRRWCEADLEAYAELNADPEVMAHLGGPMTRQQSDSLARYGESWVDRAGLGLLPVVRQQDGRMLGMCGLHHQRWYPDEVEVGWRFARHAWGHGYATESAACWLDEAFGPLGIDHVISITSPDNGRSQAVMRRLGLQPREEGTRPRLDSSGVPVVVFTISGAQWQDRRRPDRDRPGSAATR
jgi:RimJ/RimL family protein N-acetyltransferase